MATERARSAVNLKQFLDSLRKSQKKNLVSLVSSSIPAKLRKTVYLSSGGKYLKYVDFLRLFALRLGYVPVHPVVTLDYYLSSTYHKHKKDEVMKDCFSLMMDCDELWVFEERLPSFAPSSASENQKPISQFPEGVLAEIHFWLLNKLNSPLRFFTWEDVGIPKYIPDADWSLIPEEEKKEVEEEKKDHPLRFGIIDLGSSTVKLSVCSVDPNKEVEVLHKKAITVNLADGFFSKEKLQPLAVERTLQAITDCQNEALSYSVLDLKLIGTGVVRKAKNFKDFALKIKGETNLDLETLSGKDEAELIFKAVLDSFRKKDIDLVVVNAGGGSTGIVFGNNKNMQPYDLPLGISDLNEKFLSEYPIAEEKYISMKEYISKMLKQNIKNYEKKGILVYTGGELDYMIITGFPLKDFDLSLSHPKKIFLERFKKHTAKMRKMTLEELHSFMPANPNWMNGAVASNTILETTAEFLGIETIVPSNKNLSDGVLLSMIR